MNDLIAGVLRLMLQAALLIAGLVVAAGLIVAVAVLAVVFGVRLLWAKLTGRPVLAFGLGVDPAASWRRYRTWQQAATARPGAPGRGRRPGDPPDAITQDIEDVEPKDTRQR